MCWNRELEWRSLSLNSELVKLVCTVTLHEWKTFVMKLSCRPNKNFPFFRVSPVHPCKSKRKTSWFTALPENFEDIVSPRNGGGGVGRRLHIKRMGVLILRFGTSSGVQPPVMMMMMIIVSLTTFSIVIGSPRAYLGRNRIYIVIGSLHAYLTCNWRAITWVYNYRSPIWTFCNRIPVIGYPRDFHVLARALMASLASFKTKEKRYGRFRSKEVLRRHF